MVGSSLSRSACVRALNAIGAYLESWRLGAQPADYDQGTWGEARLINAQRTSAFSKEDNDALRSALKD